MAAQLLHSAAGDEPLHLYLLLVAASVGLSAFIDNIPYVAAMLPVVHGVAALMNGGAGISRSCSTSVCLPARRWAATGPPSARQPTSQGRGS